MASVVVTIKIMPDSPEADLSAIEEQAKKQIIEFADNSEIRVEQEPVAFGLKALKLLFAFDESKGDTEGLEKTLAEIEHVSSVEVVDVRRTMG